MDGIVCAPRVISSERYVASLFTLLTVLAFPRPPKGINWNLNYLGSIDYKLSWGLQEKTLLPIQPAVIDLRESLDPSEATNLLGLALSQATALCLSILDGCSHWPCEHAYTI